MMYRYGTAVVEERTQPRNLAELRHYLRMEYGLGTEPGFLLREADEGPRAPGTGSGRPSPGWSAQ